MTSQASINLLRECPVDVLIRGLSLVSEILHKQMCILFTTMLSVLCWQRSTKWKRSESNTFLIPFSYEHPVIPRKVLVQQKRLHQVNPFPLLYSSLLFCVLPSTRAEPSMHTCLYAVKIHAAAINSVHVSEQAKLQQQGDEHHMESSNTMQTG